MIRTLLKTEAVRSALGVALLYAVFLLLAPSAIRAVDHPVVDRAGIRDEANAQICAADPTSSRCGAIDSGDVGDGDEGGSGGDSGTDDGGEDGTTDDTGTDGGTTDDTGTDSTGGGSLHREVTLSLRTESGVVTIDELTLPRATAPAVLVKPTGGSTAYPVDAHSVLAQLLTLDERNDTFEISDLQYYESWGAFYVNCITVESENELCAGWQYEVNGEVAEVGIDSYELEYGDSVEVFYEPWDGDSSEDGDGAALSDTDGASGGGSLLNPDTTANDAVFDVPAALAFVETFATDEGAYGTPMLSDWVALALVAADADTDAVKEYLVGLEENLVRVTDHERRAMALLALGADADTHVAAIREAFGGVQIGDPEQMNDDIFGLLVLVGAGYSTDDEVVAGVIAHLLEEQGVNGAWDDDTDLTAAAVQALMPFAEDGDVAFALGKARVYLRTVQGEDGGFGNAFTTAWVLQAISAYGDEPSDWEKGGSDPLAYLVRAQERDGGVLTGDEEDSTRLWATAYAVPAALGLTWYDIFPLTSKTVVVTSNKTITRATDASATPSRATPVTATTDVPVSANAPAPEGIAVAAVPLETPSAFEGAPEVGDQSEGFAAEILLSDEQAAQVTTSGEGMSTALRLLALAFAALLVGFGVFRWRTV